MPCRCCQPSLAQVYEVASVVTQPDRPAGRGRGLSSPPTALWAREHGVPVLQPPSLRTPEIAEQLAGLAPDAMVVASYGRILPPLLLTVAPHGCLNVHPSLLPRHRGPSPVAEAILQGDAVTGVSIMLLDEGTDTGPVVAQEEHAIADADTAGSLTVRLFERGGELLASILPAWADGRIDAEPQDESRATYSRKLEKADGELDFTRSAMDLPQPGAGDGPVAGRVHNVARRDAQGAAVGCAASERGGERGAAWHGRGAGECACAHRRRHRRRRSGPAGPAA